MHEFLPVFSYLLIHLQMYLLVSASLLCCMLKMEDILQVAAEDHFRDSSAKRDGLLMRAQAPLTSFSCFSEMAACECIVCNY